MRNKTAIKGISFLTFFMLTFSSATAQNVGRTVLSSPENGAVDVPLQPVLEWNQTRWAVNYQLIISMTEDFSDEVVNETGISQTSFEIRDELDFQTEYFWKVRGRSFFRSGRWSEVWRFRTVKAPAPENLVISETGDAQNLLLTWDEIRSEYIDGYIIYRGPSVRQLAVLDTVNRETYSYTDTNPQEGASFYTVTAMAGEGEGEFSNLASYYNDNTTVPENWSLRSLPLAEQHIELSSSQVFGFEGVYQHSSGLLPANGYWIKSSRGDSYETKGAGLQQAMFNLQAGWNLVGALADSFAVEAIDDPSGILMNTPVFGYNGQEYEAANILIPGNGYWIYASEEGQVYLDVQNEMENRQNAEKPVGPAIHRELTEITFTRNNIRQFMFASDSPLVQNEKYQYLLPPKAPDPRLDVRTSDGYRIMDQGYSSIELTASGYPVQVELSRIPEDADFGYRIVAADGEHQKFIDLVPGRSGIIEKEYEELTLKRITAEEAIPETEITPSYPNPFNPVTTIEYRLAEHSPVRLQIFDMLGRLVATLVNESQQPGIHRVQFDGSDLSSGLYLLRIQAGEYTNVQKLTLIK